MKTFTLSPYQLTHPLEFKKAIAVMDQINKGQINIATLQEFAFYYYITPLFTLVMVKKKGYAVMIDGQYWKDCKDWVCYNCKFRIMGKE